MTTFADGPAKGKVLCLARAPLFLRVTVSPAGEVDALDQLSDTPKPEERVFVYVKARDHGSVHVDFVDKRGRRCGAWYAGAAYRLFEEQPDETTVRSKERWQEWCREKWKGGAK